MELVRIINPHHYKGFGGCDCICRVDVYREGKKFLIMFTELEDNHGTSITNFTEQLATQIAELLDIPERSLYDDVVWIEHYPANRFRGETFDEVTYTWEPAPLLKSQASMRAKSPKWKHLPAMPTSIT